MALKCKACIHEKRVDIDKAIVDGASVRDVAGRFGLTKSSIDRHRPHVSAKVARAAERKELTASSSLLDRVDWLEATARQLLDDALADDDRREANSAIKGLARVLELRGRGTGEFAPLKVQAVSPHMSFEEHKTELRRLREEIAAEEARLETVMQ